LIFMQRVDNLPLLTQAQFRFYGVLKRFLNPDFRVRTFTHTVKGHPSIKDTLEALGVPHTEINHILVDQRPVDFSYQLMGKEKIRVYPLGDIPRQKVTCLNPMPPRPVRFVIDSHLGRLVRHLRMLGFDCLYKTVFPDREIIDLGGREQRVILTRDIGLLKNKRVHYGCFLYSTDPIKQVAQVLSRYRLACRLHPFTLCLECNGRIQPVAKHKILGHLPPMVREYYRRFYVCTSCKKIYWKGTHYDKMMKLVAKFKKQGRHQ